jgi:hypothetical protein
VDEREQAGGGEPVPPAAEGTTAPLPAPAGAGERVSRGAAARRVLARRAAGWVVAAVLAGFIIGLLVSFARPSPTVAVAQAGPARFAIGPACLPPGATVIGPAGVRRQITIGPAGVRRQITIGPAGVRRQITIGPAGLPPGAVVVGPAAVHGVVACPAGPVRVFLPGGASKVSWRFVQPPVPAGAQVPAS